jgi:hypothetical protein
MRAEIKTKQALYTLIRLYSDLAGQDRDADMVHVEAVIRLISPATTWPASPPSAATVLTHGPRAVMASVSPWTFSGGPAGR